MKNMVNKKNKLWKKIFNIDSKSFKRNDYTFNHMISTDGVGVSIFLVKTDKKGNPGKKPSKMEARKHLEFITDVPYIDTIKVTKKIRKMKIAAVDPGRGDLLSCMIKNDPSAIKNTNEKNKLIAALEIEKSQNCKKSKPKKSKKKAKVMTNEEISNSKQIKMINKNKLKQKGEKNPGQKDSLNNIHVTYTQRSRLKDIKSKKYKQIRNDVKNADRTANGKKIVELEAELSKHNSKTCNFELFLLYLKVKIKVNRLLYDHYAKEIYRKLNFNTYINTKRSEDKFMNKFKEKIGSPKDTIVVIGDYSANAGIKGSSPVKGKGFRKLFKNNGYQIYLIDEFRTSKLCSHCHHNNERFFKIKTKPKIDPVSGATLVSSKDILSWKLLKCTNCKVIHNRDHNATKNMLTLTEHYFSSKERIKEFCRDS